jgi:hypothetical protein
LISLTLNNVPILFIKGYTTDDTQTIIDFVYRARQPKGDSTNLVLFIDTPATAPTVEAVKKLKAYGYKVVFRDHHGLDGEPTNDGEQKKKVAAAELHKHLGDDCTITTRALHPACSTLVTAGEFSEAVAIIADPDADGLTAAMKATGLVYPGLDDDAAKLDGEPALQLTGTDMSRLLAKGMASLPKTDPRKPESRDKAKQQLFSLWISAVQGNADAIENLHKSVEHYDGAVKYARELAQTSKEVAPGVVLVDVIDTIGFDEASLTVFLEMRRGCHISVVRKGNGPIAALHGVQYSLAVAKPYQNEINLQNFVPPGAETGPKAGRISNVSFLLHVSQEVWDQEILPALQLLGR